MISKWKKTLNAVLHVFRKRKDPALKNRTDKQGSEITGPEDNERKDVHALITHLVSLTGYEVDSVIEIKYPANGGSQYYRESVNGIVRTLENAFMNIAFTESEKFKQSAERKKSSILVDIRINSHE